MQQAVEMMHEGKTLRGMVHRPDTDAKTHPAVVLFHGFTGSKGEEKFLFVRLARALAAAGIGCVRFDFSGSGESDGDFRDMTFSGEMDEARAMLDFTRQLEWTDERRIGVLGFSMGGAIAAQITKNRSADVERLGLLAPAGSMAEKAAFYFEQCERLPNDNVDLDGIELGRGFLDDLAGRNLYEGVEQYENPVLILHGTEDAAVPVQYGKRYSGLYKKAAFHVIDGADHTFTRLEWREALIEQVVRFFAAPRQP